jgi:hypothetical protein
MIYPFNFSPLNNQLINYNINLKLKYTSFELY